MAEFAREWDDFGRFVKFWQRGYSHQGGSCDAANGDEEAHSKVSDVGSYGRRSSLRGRSHR